MSQIIVRKFQQLDSLRGLAALSVFAHHIYQQYFSEATYSRLDAFLQHLGAWGVAVFFVLSGFCIHWGRLIQAGETGKFNAGAYLRHRFFRIYPALVICLLACLIASHLHASNLLPTANPSAALWHLSLASNFFPQHRVDVNNVLWSVVLEFHFYLLYGVLWLQFTGLRRVIWTTSAAVIVAVATFLISVMLLPQGPERITLQHTAAATFWSWLLGVVIAELVAQRSSWRHLGVKRERFLLAMAWAASLAICLLPQGIALQMQRFLLPVLAALGMLLLVRSPGGILNAGPLREVGRWSYSLYLFHPLAIWLFVGVAMNPLVRIASTLALGIGFAAIGYFLIERPFIHLGRRSSLRSAPTLASR